MNPSNHEGIEQLTDTERRYEPMRYKAMEMHLFNEDADEEKALCGADTADGLIGVPGYLEDRVHGLWVGNICQECKVVALPLAEEIIERMVEDLEAEGRLDIAEDYRELGKTLAKETGQNPPGD